MQCGNALEIGLINLPCSSTLKHPVCHSIPILNLDANKMHNNTTFYELDLEQMEAANGGASTSYSLATTTAVGLTLAAGMAASPILGFALAAGGIASAGIAIFYGLTEDPNRACQ